MDKKVCVCIEGELRGAKRCGENIRKYLIDHLNADLFFCIQDYKYYDENDLKYYGEYKEFMIYSNPEPDFKNIFNDLCKIYNFEENKWQTTFTLRNDNFKLGYDKPGTCIRRMYNRYLIYHMLKKYNYDWFIILRSDLYFVDYFYDINFFNAGELTLAKITNWGGLNNNLIIFDKSIIDNILLYITNFLNLSFFNHIKQSKKKRKINEEIFFMNNMIINNVKTRLIDHMWYISADSPTAYTTWNKIKVAPNGDIYKYEQDYKTVKNLLSINSS